MAGDEFENPGGRALQGFVVAILAPLLPNRLHRLVRFAISGMAATIFYFVVTNLLVLGAKLEPVAASVAAYLLSLCLSYLLQSRFTFRTRANSMSQFARFVITGLAGLGLSYAVMFVVNERLGWSYIVGSFGTCVLIPVANYIVFRAWVFRSGPLRHDPREQTS